MKFIYLLLCILISQNIFASNNSKCKFGKFEMSLKTDQKADIQLDIYKNKTKISGCILKVISYEDGKSGVSTDELTRFELSSCNNIYDKLASKISIIKKGFIKNSSKDNLTYAYIVKNEQPLKCINN